MQPKNTIFSQTSEKCGFVRIRTAAPCQNKARREEGARTVVKKAACIFLALALVLPLTAAADDGREEKIIYLTFDDGPGIYTARLLDVLHRYGVQATFFLVNTDTSMEYLLGRMVRDGHAIGIHSYSHDFKTIYSGDEAFMKDLYAMQALIADKCGVKTTLMRFPGGSSNTVSRRYCYGIMSRLTKRVRQEGFAYFDWNVDSGDACGCHDTEAIYRNIICGIEGKSRAVVLQHDINGSSVAAVERVILWGRANGYVFRPLTEQVICRHRVQN